MSTYVLVHGGAHGGWCYARLTPLLRAAGHDVWAPTMTGVGERAHLVHPGVDLDLHVTDVANVLAYEDLRDVILVGHSYGGMVITGVADRLPDRVGQLVYLDGALPLDGESLAEMTPALMGAAHAGLRTVNGTELVLWPDDYPPEGYGVDDPATAAWMRERLTPHPWRSFTQPLRLRDAAGVRRIPRTNINCTETLRRRPPERRARAYDADQVWEIETGHDLMITAPDSVAEMMLRLAAPS